VRLRQTPQAQRTQQTRTERGPPPARAAAHAGAARPHGRGRHGRRGRCRLLFARGRRTATPLVRVEAVSRVGVAARDALAVDLICYAVLRAGLKGPWPNAVGRLADGRTAQITHHPERGPRTAEGGRARKSRRELDDAALEAKLVPALNHGGLKVALFGGVLGCDGLRRHAQLEHATPSRVGRRRRERLVVPVELAVVCRRRLQRGPPGVLAIDERAPWCVKLVAKDEHLPAQPERGETTHGGAPVPILDNRERTCSTWSTSDHTLQLPPGVSASIHSCCGFRSLQLRLVARSSAGRAATNIAQGGGRDARRHLRE
jgi:hypothetical protein